MGSCANTYQRVKEMGNLAKHAMTSHSGTCVYINVLQGTVILCEFGRFMFIDNLYTDKFGMSFMDHATPFL